MSSDILFRLTEITINFNAIGEMVLQSYKGEQKQQFPQTTAFQSNLERYSKKEMSIPTRQITYAKDEWMSGSNTLKMYFTHWQCYIVVIYF